MKFSPVLFASGVALALVAGALGQQAPAEDVLALKSRFKGEFDRLAAAEQSSLAPVSAAYAKELTRLLAAAKSKGDLNATLELEKAVKGVEAGQFSVPAKTASAAALSAFATFEKNKAAALKLHASKRQQLQAESTRAFGELEQRFTRSGQIDAAKLAQEARMAVPGNSVETIAALSGATVTGDGVAKSPESFPTPVEVEFLLKTDGQVRLGYACKQIIFNWEVNPNELRIDGGPVGGQHKKGAGSLPLKRSVSIKLAVLPKQMTISVDGRERARWTGDFSTINQPISIHAHSSTVQIEQVRVRKLQ